MDRRVFPPILCCVLFLTIPLTYIYTYLGCSLGVKMRSHKMAEIWEWLLSQPLTSTKSCLWAFSICFVRFCCVIWFFQEKIQLYTSPNFSYLTNVPFTMAFLYLDCYNTTRKSPLTSEFLFICFCFAFTCVRTFFP